MGVDHSDVSGGWKVKLCTIGVVAAIVFAGAAIGLSLAMLDLVLAPPWTSLTSLPYLSLACLGLPIAVLAGFMKWVKIPMLLLALVGMGITSLFYLVLIGPWLPRGMTNCQAISMPSPQIRYICASTASDDSDYRHEFLLDGREGWPIMRLTRQNR